MATQRRQITADEYRRLAELGVLGESVELIDGWIVYGRYPFAFSEEAITAARAAGVELDAPAQAAGDEPGSRGMLPAPTDVRGRDVNGGEAIVLRRLKPGEFDRLLELGVIPRKVELIKGLLPSGFPFAISREAVEVARAAGIELDTPRESDQLSFERRAAVVGEPFDERAMPDPEAIRAALAPSPELARTLAARLAWEDLETILLIRIEERDEPFAAAVAWMAEPDEALDGHSPAYWIAAGGDRERLERLARRGT